MFLFHRSLHSLHTHHGKVQLIFFFSSLRFFSLHKTIRDEEEKIYIYFSSSTGKSTYLSRKLFTCLFCFCFINIYFSHIDVQTMETKVHILSFSYVQLNRLHIDCRNFKFFFNLLHFLVHYFTLTYMKKNKS